jgi:hypothetical protein
MLRKAIGHLISCREASLLVSRLQDEELPAWQRFRLRAHLAVCTACMRFERQLEILRRAMRAYRS